MADSVMWHKLTLVAAIIAIFGVLLWVGMQQVVHETDPWLYPVITDGEVEAVQWIRENTKPDAKFLTGIFGGEYIMGMTTRIPLIGGDWGNAPDPIKKMEAVDKFFKTNDAEEAYNLAKGYGVDYISVPSRADHTGFGWVYPSASKFSDQRYFELVYDNSGVPGIENPVRIYKLK